CPRPTKPTLGLLLSTIYLLRCRGPVSSLQGDRHGLLLGAVLDPGPPELTADAAAPGAAPRKPRVDDSPAVHPHGARAQLAREQVRARYVPGPDRRRQPVVGPIGEPDRLSRVIERDHRADRSEDL